MVSAFFKIRFFTILPVAGTSHDPLILHHPADVQMRAALRSTKTCLQVGKNGIIIYLFDIAFCGLVFSDSY